MTTTTKHATQLIEAAHRMMVLGLTKGIIYAPEVRAAVRLSMVKNLASMIWEEDGYIYSEDFDTDREMLTDAFTKIEFIPDVAMIIVVRGWHDYLHCDWIWTEDDKDGDEFYVCKGESGIHPRFSTMKQMWEELLDRVPFDSNGEINRICRWIKDQEDFGYFRMNFLP